MKIYDSVGWVVNRCVGAEFLIVVDGELII